MKENPMREIRIEKITLNIGCGTDKNKLERAKRLLETLSEQKVLTTLSRKRSTFGVTKRKPIGVKVTLRKENAKKFLRNVLSAVDNELKESQINDGNFSIGVKEYIDLPKIKYDPKLGIKGFDVLVSLRRPGYRIKRRKIDKKRIPAKHIIKKKDAIDFVKKFFGVEVE